VARHDVRAQPSSARLPRFIIPGYSYHVTARSTANPGNAPTQPALKQIGNIAPGSAPRSWRDPAGGSPARVSRSGRSVASVAWRKATTVAKRTQQSLRGGLLSRERAVNAEAEAVDRAEGNISNAVMRGAATLPWSKTPSRMKGSHRNVGELAIDRMAFCHAARVGKAMSRSRR